MFLFLLFPNELDELFVECHHLHEQLLDILDIHRYGHGDDFTHWYFPGSIKALVALSEQLLEHSDRKQVLRPQSRFVFGGRPVRK